MVGDIVGVVIGFALGMLLGPFVFDQIKKLQNKNR